MELEFRPQLHDCPIEPDLLKAFMTLTYILDARGERIALLVTCSHCDLVLQGVRVLPEKRIFRCTHLGVGCAGPIYRNTGLCEMHLREVCQ